MVVGSRVALSFAPRRVCFRVQQREKHGRNCALPRSATGSNSAAVRNVRFATTVAGSFHLARASYNTREFHRRRVSTVGNYCPRLSTFVSFSFAYARADEYFQLCGFFVCLELCRVSFVSINFTGLLTRWRSGSRNQLQIETNGGKSLHENA